MLKSSGPMKSDLEKEEKALAALQKELSEIPARIRAASADGDY
jgi:hypothetical protein